MRTLLCCLLLFVVNVAAGGAPLAGTVLDSSGAAVPNARVRLEASAATIAERVTGDDGRFEFSIEVTSNLRIVVTANGFAQA